MQHRRSSFDLIFKILVPINIPTFQDLSFSFSDQPRGTCPRGQKHVLKLVHEKKITKVEKNHTSRPDSTTFFPWVTYIVFERLNFKKWDPIIYCLPSLIFSSHDFEVFCVGGKLPSPVPSVSHNLGTFPPLGEILVALKRV